MARSSKGLRLEIPFAELSGPLTPHELTGLACFVLSEGNIQHTVDLRSVYSTVLADWLKAPNMKPILGANYPKLGFIGA